MPHSLQRQDRRLRRWKLDNRARRASLIETAVNIAVGAGINAALSFALLSIFTEPPAGWGSLVAVAVFTPASVLRGYLLRRLFVWLDLRNR